MYQNPLLAYRHRTGAPRVTSWQKGVPFVPVISPCDQWHKNGRPSQQPHPTVRGDPWEPCGQGSMWPGQRQIPGSSGVTHHLETPWNVEGAFGVAQRQHLGSWKSIQLKRERSESVREEGWGTRLTTLWGGGSQGWSLCFAPTTMRLTRCTEAVLLGADAPGTDLFLSPLCSHGSLHVAGALMAFKCLTRAHTMRTCLA